MDNRFVRARHDVVERAYDQMVGVVPVVLGAVLVSVSVAHIAANLGTLSLALSGVSLLVGTLLLVLPTLVRGIRLSHTALRVILLAALGFGAIDALAAQWVSGGIGRSADLMLLVIGAGFVLPERAWFRAALAVTVVPWVAVTVAVGGLTVAHQLLSAAGAVLVAVVVRRTRVRGLDDSAVAEVTVVHTTSDTLTGVNNRRGLDLVGTHLLAIAARQQTEMGCTYVAVPGLELIAREHGDDSVESILATVARCLNAATRATDVVGRVSPDTFAVLAHGSGATIEMLRERLSTAFALSCDVPIELWDRRLDFGRAVWQPGDPVDLLEVMQAAEEDLHRRAGWSIPADSEWAAQHAAYVEHIRDAGIDEDLRRRVLSSTGIVE